MRARVHHSAGQAGSREGVAHKVIEFKPDFMGGFLTLLNYYSRAQLDVNVIIMLWSWSLGVVEHGSGMRKP